MSKLGDEIGLTAIMVGLASVLIIVALAIGPLALIWSLNTLFGLGIPFTTKTWFAMLILGCSVGGASYNSKD